MLLTFILLEAFIYLPISLADFYLTLFEYIHSLYPHSFLIYFEGESQVIARYRLKLQFNCNFQLVFNQY